MLKNVPCGMSGADGTRAADKKLEKDSCCGVGKLHFGQEMRYQ